MPGVVFLVVIPTEKYERKLENGYEWDNNELPPPPLSLSSGAANVGMASGGNNLNINLPDNNAILRLEVELRDKNAPKSNRRGARGKGIITGVGAPAAGRKTRARTGEADIRSQNEPTTFMVPMEKVLEELLSKLEIEHVTWSSDKKGNYYHVFFPIQSGEPCETTLHCLTELGIGTKLNSSVSEEDAGEELSKWNNFVESIKSKLTVKQVVDGVRAGGSLSFDYLLLIVTADSLAALGLVENNAPNIVAAMLVSPLMGPVMSITFGAIISDRELLKVGFISLALGIFISILFGFIFGLILGTTDMPWGFTDWPTEEMKGRGNARSLWMGVLWALTSGTGVAVALLQGSAGPLIGVAISASLLPPVVNCGLFWALACIWLIYPDIKMPHLKGETYNGNSSYQFIYTNYLPTEFLINGIVSGLLTIVNVICIFITAIIVLKIKEVAAPYTSSPDLRRFWETDIRAVRKINRSTIRRRPGIQGINTLNYDGTNHSKDRELGAALEQALKEAVDDDTFRKVKRMSYLSNAAGELTQRLALNSGTGLAGVSGTFGEVNSVRNSKLNADLQALDKLVSSLLEHHNIQQHQQRKGSTKLNRLRPFSQSLTGLMGRGNSIKSPKAGAVGSERTTAGFRVTSDIDITTGSVSVGDGHSSHQHTTLMPTIPEQNQSSANNSNRTTTSSWSDKSPAHGSNVRRVLNTIANAPHRFSESISQTGEDEESTSLTRSIVE